MRFFPFPRPFLAAVLFFSSPVDAQNVSTKADKDEVAFMADQEPAMRKAFEKASATLPDFLAKARAASPDHTHFALKVAVSEGGSTEYFWVNGFSQRSDGNFVGDIANEPRMLKSVRNGQRYVFPRSRIVDWTYIDERKRAMVGNFTLCALLTKESRSEAEAMKKRFKLDCDWLQP